MDYFLELASHPDVLEAIRRERDRNLKHAKAADDLLLSEFLSEEHPTAWTIEVLRAFYRTPEFAARVWRNLRYCEGFRQRLSEYKLRADSRWWSSTKDDVPAINEAVKKFGREPRKAVQECSEAIREDTIIERLIRETGLRPEPPTFLRVLMEAVETPASDYDDVTQRLLESPELVRRLARKTGVAVPFSMVLHDELEQIETTRGNVHRVQRPRHADPSVAASVGTSGEDAPIRRALDMDLLGLAFSGGGIRSATFNLGVLQSLSKIGLLRQCDYLSTVSGGGYIGSWLSAWIRREANAAGDSSSTMVDIQRRLSPIRSPNPMDERVRPIRFLREYSNYLTPRSGFFSADSWTMIGIYVRNALLNQVIIVTLFGAALIVPRLIFGLTRFGRIDIWLPWSLWVLGALVLIVNLIRLRPPQLMSAQANTRAPKLDDPIYRWLFRLARPWVVQVGVVLPWMLAAAMAATYFSYPATSPPGGFAASETFLSVAAGTVVTASLLVILVLGRVDRCWARPKSVPKVMTPWRRRVEKWSRRAKGLIAPIYNRVTSEKTRAELAHIGSDFAQAWHATWVILLAVSVSGVVAASLTWVVVRTLSILSAMDSDARQWHAIALGTAGLLSVLSLSIVVMLGMLGEKFPDEHREWWSKFRTFVHVWAIGWVAAYIAAVYVPWGFHWLMDRAYSAQISASAVVAWLASTLFGVLTGRTAEDDKKQEHESGGEAAPLSTRVMGLATRVAPYVFIVGLVFGISIAIDRVFGANLPDRQAYLDELCQYWPFATWASTGEWWTLSLPRVGLDAIHVPWTLTATLGLLGVGLLFSWRVDINDFSLHHFYKNRLVRCYLGASHTAERQADCFTGFDPRDDVRLKDFDHDAFEGPKYPGPYPILNCALNLVGGQDLAWQERKSASFVFTPKFCGYDVDRAVITPGHNGLREDAYVPTRNYYHPGEGPFLGMAMAISGAAANPNMGRASSPAMAFLMTVFNVRLGWWVGNPRKRDGVAKPSPRIGLPYTALELFGGTDDRKKYVNLSDGGHFENLGVYELIRRGCRYIILCDAGQDDKFLGEDLATLVRQCRTDFGVEIDIDIHRICERKERISQTHCVVGQIHYHHIPRRTPFGRLMSEDEGPLLRGSRPAHEEGYLIYLKPSLTGDEAQDLVEFAKRITEFPHQTTADQWFDESQFESYRKLGMHIGEEAFQRYQDDDTKPLADLGQLFARLRDYWYPPSQAINANSTYHVNEYTRIMELIRTQPALRNLDHTMFEKWPDTGIVDPREEFYVCNALIQLIENVYADLDLEHLWEHPHVQGWMTVFRRWAQQPPFRRTWNVCEWSYAERFRNFYNDRLRGRPIALPRSFVSSHRGLGNGLKENTIDAFMYTMSQGASVVELDVRKLRDGNLVLWHDDTIGDIPVEAFTLPKLRLRAWYYVETLDECAKELLGRVQLDVEIKTPGIEADVLGVLRSAKWRRRDFVLTSFDDEMIQNVHALDPHVRTGLLLEHRPDFDRAFDQFVALGADFLGPQEGLITKDDLDRAAEQRVPLVPWSVNDEKRLEFLLKHDIVAGVITDDVSLAVDVKRRI